MDDGHRTYSQSIVMLANANVLSTPYGSFAIRQSRTLRADPIRKVTGFGVIIRWFELQTRTQPFVVTMAFRLCRVTRLAGQVAGLQGALGTYSILT